jgi:hypothetical protein
LRDLSSSLETFEQLAIVHEWLGWHEGKVGIDLASAQQAVPSMCAPLAAVRERRSSSVNASGKAESSVRLRLPQGFTFRCQHYETTEWAKFKKYVENYFADARMPTRRPILKKMFLGSLSEVFLNSLEHSKTKLGIFVSDHYSPEKRILEVSIADRGIGIRENIRRERGLTFSPEDAIEWAMEGTNTTRRGRRTGGLGLKLIRNFLRYNGGRLQIASDQGYMCIEGNAEPFFRRLEAPFPGTVVNIEIRTADTHSYRPSEEIDPNTIF